MGNKEKTKNDFIDRLSKKTALMMVIFLFIFGVPAVLSAYFGNFIDEKFNIKPLGNLIFLIISYIVSWGIALSTYRYIRKQEKLSVKEDKNE